MKVANPNVAVEPELGHWSKDDGVKDLPFIGISDTTISVNVVYRPPEAGPASVYLGGGPSIHRWKSSASVLGIDASDARTTLGAQALIGANFKASPRASVFVTIRYDFVARPRWSSIGSVSLNGGKAYGGFRVSF